MKSTASANGPLVTIVVPTYNRVGLLKRLIKSVVSQTYKNIEIIIVNNGSTDETMLYLNSLSEIHDNIAIHSFQKNTGSPMACYNKGIDLATGEYISFIYDDDTLVHDGVEFLIGKMLAYKLDWAVGNCVDNRTGAYTFYGPVSDCEITFDDIILERFTGEAWGIIRKALFGDIRFDPEMYGGESSVWLQLYKKTSARYFHRAVRVYYTQHGGNITGIKGIIKNTDKIYYTEKKYIDLFGKEFNENKILKYKYYRLSLILLLAGKRIESYKYVQSFFEISKLHRIFALVLLSLLPVQVLVKLVEFRARIRNRG
jgi:GalNAc5-diNAcBac-PP-undecaprenol beta-1,3-glucosyltransferase